MEKRPLQSKRRYFFAFLIGTAIFLLGFIITHSIAYLEYLRISDIQGQVSYGIFKDKLEFSLFEGEICDTDSLRKVSEDLGFQGRIIDDLEKEFGKNDERVLFRKRFYTLVELEHFEFVKEINKECRLSIPFILFFYSNEPGDAEKSEDAGRILGIVSERNPNLLIYSFDINLESDLITHLKEKYEIEFSPTIMINEKKKLENFESIPEIEKYLK